MAQAAPPPLRLRVDVCGPEHLILGLAGAAGLYHKPHPQGDVIHLIRSAVIDHGIRVLDTAPWYGCGKSELDLGAAIDDIARTHAELVSPPPSSSLSQTPPLSSHVTIFTKVGRVTLKRSDLTTDESTAALAQQFGVSLAAFKERCESALTRDTCYFPHPETNDLVCVEVATASGVEHSWASTTQRLGPRAASLVKSLRLHDADTEALIREATTPHTGALSVLGSIGPNATHGASLGLNSPSVALQYLIAAASDSSGHCSLTSVMIAGSWNLLDQSALHLLQECQTRGVAVHLAGVFAGGYLWGGSQYKYAPVPPGEEGASLVQRRDDWAVLAEQFGLSLPCVAMQFALLPQCVSHAAIGCSTASELDASVSLLKSFLPQSVFLQLLKAAADKNLLGVEVAMALGL